jgi:hypothetical protein
MIQEPEMARHLGVDLLEIQASLLPTVSRRGGQVNTHGSTASVDAGRRGAEVDGGKRNKHKASFEDLDTDKSDADSKFWSVTNRDDVLMHAVSQFMCVCVYV